MRASRSLLGMVTSLLLVTACAPAPQRDAPPAPVAATPPSDKAAPTVEAPAPEAVAPKLTFVPDAAMMETRDSRDPFRSFDTANPTPPTDKRPRKSRHYALDELKLVGLVTSTDLLSLLLDYDRELEEPEPMPFEFHLIEDPRAYA